MQSNSTGKLLQFILLPGHILVMLMLAGYVPKDLKSGNYHCVNNEDSQIHLVLSLS